MQIILLTINKKDQLTIRIELYLTWQFLLIGFVSIQAINNK